MIYKNLDQYKLLSKDEDIVVTDFETNSNPYFKDGVIVGLGIYFPRKDKAIYIQTAEHVIGTELRQVVPTGEFKYILDDLKTKKHIAHNLQYELGWYNRMGYDIDPYWCTRIAQHILSPEMVKASSYYSLDWLIENILNQKSHKEEFKAHLRSKAKENGITEIEAESRFYLADLEVISQYCIDDCKRTYELYSIQKPMIENIKAYDFMTQIPIQYLYPLNNQYETGITIDKKRMERVLRNNRRIMNKIDESFLKDKEIGAVVKEILDRKKQQKASTYKTEKSKEAYLADTKRHPKINFNSGDQLAEVLQKLNVNIIERTNGGKVATDKATLKKYKGTHKIIDRILKRSDFETSCKFLQQYINVTGKDNKYYLECDVCATASGRLAAYAPNFLAAPRRDKRIMKCFTTSSEDRVLLSFDFDQVEPRVLAHFTNDEITFNVVKYKWDLYLEHMEAMMPEKVSLYDRDNLKESKKILEKERDLLKKAILAINYGAGVNKIAYLLEVSEEEARVMFNGYWKAHYAIKNFGSQLTYLYNKDGCVKNLFGRPLVVGNMKDIVNRFIQSSAHDSLIALNLILHDKLKEVSIDCKPVAIDYHDEGIWEISKKDLDKFIKIVYDSLNELNEQINLKLPLEIDYKIADNMSEFK